MRGGRPDKSTAGACLTKPQRPVTPFAARVHGLTNQVLDDKPGWEEIKGAVHRLLGTAWIAAYHAHVDYRVMSAHLPQWRPAAVIDTLRLAKATYPGLPTYSLDALIEHASLDLAEAPGQRHCATFDAYATTQLLITMAGRCESWDQLVASPSRPASPAPPNQSRSAPCGGNATDEAHPPLHLIAATAAAWADRAPVLRQRRMIHPRVEHLVQLARHKAAPWGCLRCHSARPTAGRRQRRPPPRRPPPEHHRAGRRRPHPDHRDPAPPAQHRHHPAGSFLVLRRAFIGRPVPLTDRPARDVAAVRLRQNTISGK
ncbi:exonuclease domain-containing protein [Streptomyces sp. SM12]|uniref:3'-5' exonuclease n=1 Tax=Streptomyces sp. SM12 TaxID=1071602 RepID=UPI0021561863|nr:exonuclease domain-containing protein [Streptomyces sp. SM12]